LRHSELRELKQRALSNHSFEAERKAAARIGPLNVVPVLSNLRTDMNEESRTISKRCCAAENKQSDGKRKCMRRWTGKMLLEDEKKMQVRAELLRHSRSEMERETRGSSPTNHKAAQV
jgi:hypothetical protein